MNFLVSYDLDKGHEQVKQTLLDRGYLDWFAFAGNAQKYYLPNTTFWHDKKSSSQDVLSELKSVCSVFGVNLERIVVTQFADISAIQGKPYSLNAGSQFKSQW